MEATYKFSLLSVIIILLSVRDIVSISLRDELTLTYSEKIALDKLRERVASRLPHAYMKEDIYLVKWLRVRNFDVRQAEEMLMENIRWRKEQRMDTVLQEDWSDMETDYPYHLNIFDKQGQPVIIGEAGEWDLRRASITGNMGRMVRYMDRATEQVVTKIRELQHNGKNVTRFNLIINLDGFNMARHSCPPCIGRFVQMLSSSRDHYPESSDKVVIINAPPIFGFVLDIIKATVASGELQRIKIFDSNRENWQKYLFQFIDKDQLRPEYGGTRSS